MRTTILALISLMISIAAGCCTGNENAMARDDQCALQLAGPRAELATALLFDRQPGRYHASDFAFRSEWPSTVSFYSPGQMIYYRERFVDYQGRGFDESNSTYRRFESYREGVGYR